MLINVIFPVMFVMLAGYLFGRFTQVDQSALSRFAMVILSPALIFSFLVRNPLTSTEMIQIVGSILVFTLLIVIITIVVLKITGNQKFVNPALLSTVFPNTGNYGLPVLLLAYGKEAFTLGVVIVVINFILMYSLGIYFASLDNGINRKDCLLNIMKLPTTYATLFAIVINLLKIPIPDFLYNPIKLIGDAMVPVALLILGMQLSKTKIKGYVQISVILSLLRLMVSPLLIIGIIYVAGITGLIAKVLVLLNSMPTAVVMTLIAAEYNAHSEMVANVTFLTTIFSFVSITLLLYILNLIYV